MKLFIRSVIFSLLFCSKSAIGMAQSGGLRFEQMGREEGLLNTQVWAILQDSKGYIWIGTAGGLNKYDGYSFTRYQFDPADSNSLSQNFIYTIWEDSKGAIWVGTFEGLCKFDRNTEKFTRYRPKSTAKFSDPNINAINEDASGMMWVGNASGGLCRFDRQTGTFLPEKFDLGFRNLTGEHAGLHDGIGCIYKDRSGTLWVGNRSGLHEIKLITGKTSPVSGIEIKHYQHDPLNPNSLSNNILLSVFEDHAGILWIGTADGLNSFDRNTGLFKRFRHDPGNIYSINSNSFNHWFGRTIVEDQEKNLWIATDKGLNKLNRQRDSFIAYRHNPNDKFSISTDDITTLCLDRTGILWAGSWTGKLNKTALKQKPFGLLRHDPGNNISLSSNDVTALLEDASGIIWIGTAGGGLNRWDRKSNRITHFRNKAGKEKTLSGDVVNAILEDRHGHLWVCNGNMLSLFNRQTGEFTHYNSNAANYSDWDHRLIYAITEDKEGFIWLGTGNGIKRFDESTGEFIHYYHDPADTSGISDYTATTIFADSKDNIWVGYGSIATDRLDKKTRRIRHYKHNAGDSTSISANIVNCFIEDSKGNLWIGTAAGGLCRYDYSTEKFITYTIKHGLPDNTVYSILEDNYGKLWLGTGNGLSSFDPVSTTFTNYDFQDGLQNAVFAAGHRTRPARFKGRDGILYFGGPGGINYFEPSQLKANSTPAPVVITQFRLFDKPVKGANESNEIVLKHFENYFSFEFSSLSFYNPAKNQYAYKLEGVDADWVYSGSRRYAGYTNIRPGRYTFRVKATNNDGVWNEEGTSISLLIRPPWWLSWWAYMFYGLVVVASILAIHRFQKQRVIRRERERTNKRELEQAREIEKAYRELKNTQQQLIQAEKMASLGELTAGIAHEIQNPLNFVNNFSEINEELVDELVQELDKGNRAEVRSIAETIRENEKKISFHGKRADAIVKSMLQHSRNSSGQKELTDINTLADECLRLSYHGLRAKDKSFNSATHTEFDSKIPPVPVVPQEIGRVLLNLLTNAFYSVMQKKKQLVDEYEPMVVLKTSFQDLHPGKAAGVIISVWDNGKGIPQHVIDKIFQPFFTTKPTGEGTGLGLSMSYDIVTKTHGGELRVKSAEGEWAEFTIILPI